MDEMQGMAAMGMQKGSMTSGITVEEVVDVLMQGATPEELLQMGVPQNLIDQAMAMISSQQPTGKEGLAGIQPHMKG